MRRYGKSLGEGKNNALKMKAKGPGYGKASSQRHDGYLDQVDRHLDSRL